MEIMEEKRNKTIRFRVNDAEYESINNRANGSVSDWLRSMALDQKPKRKPKPVNPELIYHLNKIGVNLNQIAKYCNQQSIFKDGDKVDLLLILASMENELKELRDKYDS